MIEYEVEGRIAVITGDSDKNIITLEIPTVIDNKIVGKIKENAFSEYKKLKSVTIPKTVKVIEPYAFAACNKLSELILQEGVETIDDWAFISCAIEKLVMPSTIKKIGKNAFLGCPVKSQIDEYSKAKFQDRLSSKLPNVNIAVWPDFIYDNKEKIALEDFKARNEYLNNQINKYEDSQLEFHLLDVPFVFDQTIFTVVCKTKSEVTNFNMALTLESKMQIGLYNTDDPDFLSIKANCYDNKEFLGEAYIKVPYLENATFDILEVTNIKVNNANLAFVKVKANLDCFGTGNYNFEFQMNHFDHLDGKYYQQFQAGILTDIQYRAIKYEINQISHKLLRKFLSEVSSAPMLKFAINMLQAVRNDEEFDTLNLEQFIDNKLDEVYNYLSDANSLKEYTFNVNDTLAMIEETTKYDLASLQARYDIYLTNDTGDILDDIYLKAYENDFENVEENYLLHGKYLNYIYAYMDKLNNKYAKLTYAVFF